MPGVVDRRVSVTTLLGTGALLVLSAGLVTAALQAGSGSAGPVDRAAGATPAATATATADGTAARTPDSEPAAKPHRDRARVVGAAAHRRLRAHRLPFTGSPPVPPTVALGLLLAAGGAWVLVRVPARVAPVLLPDAIDRLRSGRGRRPAPCR